MTRLTLAFALALTTLALVAAPAAQASHVQCGDVITQDTKLDSDLLNCPGDGVVIGAANITLDLNGHLIDGTGPPTSGVGVNNTAGHDGVTVMDGRIQEFAGGVRLINASDNVITRLTVTRLFGLVSVEGDSDRNVISRNAGERTGILVIHDSDDNLIERNTLGSIQIIGGFPNAERNRIERNTISDGLGDFGIWSSAERTTVRQNVVSDTRFGIETAGFGALIAQNTVSNTEVGINVFGQASQNQLVRNDLVDNTGDGINVGALTSNTLLDRNNASRNGDDGIDVEIPSTTLTKNTANFNGDLGIEAVPGVIDGGGNKARGNGNPAQCLNVSCK